MDIKKIKSLKIRDLTDYEPGRSNNGGCYSFESRYSRENPGELFMAEYSTSADFPYCDVKGTFQECRGCYDYDEERGCIAEYGTVAEEELLKTIERIGLLESIYIDYKNFKLKGE
jgi:hypothetical protein